MPIYSIKCDVCDWKGEVICKYEALEITTCEKCGCSTSLIPSKPATFFIEGACEANGYETASNMPDDHYDPRVGQATWD